METRFTEGPYRKVDNGETITIRAADGSLLCGLTFLTKHGRRDIAEVTATGDLFTASPDLYAALVELTADLERRYGKDWPISHGVVIQIFAALAKARGEEVSGG